MPVRGGCGPYFGNSTSLKMSVEVYPERNLRNLEGKGIAASLAFLNSFLFSMCLGCLQVGRMSDMPVTLKIVLEMVCNTTLILSAFRHFSVFVSLVLQL